MSNIAKQKALEAYPDKYIHLPFGINIADINDFKRESYAKGYNQAYQDFLEKAEEFIYEQFNIHQHDCHVVQYVSDTPLEDIDDFVEQFKNYMQNE